MTQTEFHHAKPIYEYFEGWQTDISGCRTFEDLPGQRADLRPGARGDLRGQDLGRRASDPAASRRSSSTADLPDPPDPARRPAGRARSLATRTPHVTTSLRCLVIGTGGREHALALALSRDPGVAEVHAAPGQPRHRRGRDAARRRRDGPGARWPRWPPRSAPTWSSSVRRRRWSPVSPTRCARRASPASARRARPPGSRAPRRSPRRSWPPPACRPPARPPATTPEQVAAALDAFGAPYVVKDDALAAGKGVVVTTDRDEALAHAAACGRVVVEEFLDGPEVSLFAVCDGTTTVPAAAGAGLQADLRRRPRPEHRRHGLLHAADLGARRPGEHRGRAASCEPTSTRWPAAARRSWAASTSGSR